MTNKIIIDGIDVSECEFREECTAFRFNYGCGCRGDYKEYDLHTRIHCADNPNCYYKQLQRAKVEIEAFKQSEQEGLEIVTELREKNKRLTCKILEEAALNNTLCSICEQCEDLTKLQAENEKLKAELQEAQDNYVKLDLERVEQNKKLIKEKNKVLRENKKLLKEIRVLNKENYALEYNCREFERLLKEAKEITEEIIKQKIYEPDIDIILTKINEVLK